MNAISSQRCFVHSGREAVARCPECRRFFCRECVTEHEGRVLCAGCIRKLSQRQGRKTSSLRTASLALQCFGGFLALWLLFYFLGQSLLKLPSSFHEGTLWDEQLEE
ncbi:MAG: rhomboid family protein [Kiritimatiellia bacterium]